MINRRTSLQHLAIGVAVLAWLAHAVVAVPAARRALKGSRPNIILVMTDDQGMGDLGCLGNMVLRTPHLDRFYEKATRFTEFHVSPTCAPTRSAIMSGRHEFRNGVTHTILERERMALSKDHPQVVRYEMQLKERGIPDWTPPKW